LLILSIWASLSTERKITQAKCYSIELVEPKLHSIVLNAMLDC
jgi:hypothetical protein